MNVFLFSFPDHLALEVRKHPDIRESGKGWQHRSADEGTGVRGCCGCLGLDVEGCDIGQGLGRSVCVMLSPCLCDIISVCLWDVIAASVGEGLCGASVGL